MFKNWLVSVAHSWVSISHGVSHMCKHYNYYAHRITWGRCKDKYLIYYFEKTRFLFVMCTCTPVHSQTMESTKKCNFWNLVDIYFFEFQYSMHTTFMLCIWGLRSCSQFPTILQKPRRQTPVRTPVQTPPRQTPAGGIVVFQTIIVRGPSIELI